MSRVPETEMCSTEIGSGLAGKHLIRLENLARDKHSSLFILQITDVKSYNMGFWTQCYKNFLCP